MSAIPIPKPSGLRPPFGGGPPIRTTFDGSPSGDSDPEAYLLRENVLKLLGSIEFTAPDRLEVLLELLLQRKRWVESELTVERLLSDDSLPPIGGFALDYLLEPMSQEESILVRLLNRLDEGIFRVKAKIAAQMERSPSSDL